MAKQRKNRPSRNQASDPKGGDQQMKQRMIREKAEALFDSAVELVIQTQKGSISLLQHKLKIDYLVAAELIKLLEREGIIGPYSSTGPREVLIGGIDEETKPGEEDEKEVEVVESGGEEGEEEDVADESEEEDVVPDDTEPENNGESQESEEFHGDEAQVESEAAEDTKIETQDRETTQNDSADSDLPGTKARGTQDSKHHKHWPAIISVFVVFGLFALFFWPGLLKTSKTVNAHFTVEVKLADLLDTDNGICDIIIDGQKFTETDYIGTAEFDYVTQRGESISIEFRKDNYESLSDSIISIEDSKNIYQLVRFKSISETSKPTEIPVAKEEMIKTYQVNLSFYNNSNYSNIIMFNGDSLTTIVAKGSYSWDSTFVDSNQAHIEFNVQNDSIPLATSPRTLIYNVNRNINTKVAIYAILDRPVYTKVLFLEKESRTPLNNVEIKFSDSKDKQISDDQGFVLYELRENRLGKSVSMTLPQKFVKFVDGNQKFSMAALTRTTPDTILDTVYCNVTYAVQLKIMDQNEEPIKQAKVIFDGTKKKTNNDGSVSFTVNNRNKSYSVKIEKERYNSVNTTIRPTGFISLFPIELMGTYGSIILIDSLQNEVTVPYVDIVEGNQVLAQTNSEGKCTINIMLGKPINLLLKPLPSSKYKSKKIRVTFQRPNETLKIKIAPKPFTFIFNITDDKGKKLKGVNINYNGLSYTTDRKGHVEINDYVIKPKPSEEFEIVYYNYMDKRIVPTDESQRVYQISHVIGTKVDLEIRTNPEKGNVRVLDMSGNEIINQKAPAKITLDLGSYIFIAEDKSGKYAEERRDINGKPDAPIVLDMVNNISIILAAYRDEDYQKVVQVYSRNKSKIMNDLDQKPQYRSNKCDILRSIAKAHSQINKYKEAKEIWQNLIIDCEVKNPYFYNDYAIVLEHNNKWAEAADAYRKSGLYIELLPINKRAEYNATLSYKQAYCRFNNYKLYKNGEINIDSPCDYLSEIKDKLNDCKRAVNAGGLVDFPIANVDNLMAQVIEEGYDCAQ